MISIFFKDCAGPKLKNLVYFSHKDFTFCYQGSYNTALNTLLANDHLVPANCPISSRGTKHSTIWFQSYCIVVQLPEIPAVGAELKNHREELTNSLYEFLKESISHAKGKTTKKFVQQFC